MKLCHLIDSSLVIKAINDCIDEGLRDGNDLSLAIKGDCMAPLLQNGGSVQIAQQSNYLPGDIVAYFCPYKKERLLHRVLGRVAFDSLIKESEEQRYLIKADNGLKPDTLVRNSLILGKAVDLKVAYTKRLSCFVVNYYWQLKIYFNKFTVNKESE